MSDKTEQQIEELSGLIQQMSVLQRTLSESLTTKVSELHAHHKQLYAHQSQIYSQIDALFSIFSLINIRYPLPTMRGWPVSPDFVKLMAEVILEIKPLHVLEAGSGVSSIVCGYLFEKLDQGHVISLDHDPSFAASTQKNVLLHNLEQKITVFHAELTSLNDTDFSGVWYNKSVINLPEAIDMVIVDGPPSSMGKLIRYPILPFVYEKMPGGSVVLVDDASRDEEKQMVDKWMQRYPDFEYSWINTEKGAVKLTKK